MKTTADFIDALRVKLDLPSDYALAGKLGMQRQYMSRYRNNVVTFDDAMAVRVADILEVDSGFVMACMNYQRAKQPEVKRAWQKVANHLGGIAAVLAMVSILPYSPLPWDGFNTALVGVSDGGSVVYYVKSLCYYTWLLIPLGLVALYHLPAKTRRPS